MRSPARHFHIDKSLLLNLFSPTRLSVGCFLHSLALTLFSLGVVNVPEPGG